MPLISFLILVFVVEVLVIEKEAGPVIFIQSHSRFIPSGSPELLPSSEILSLGKVITWSGPATAFGGLLSFLQFLLENSFSQEVNPIDILKRAIENGTNNFIVRSISLNKLFYFLITRKLNVVVFVFELFDVTLTPQIRYCWTGGLFKTISVVLLVV